MLLKLDAAERDKGVADVYVGVPMSALDLAPIVNALLAVQRPHPVRVGIDGFCAAGKTTLANALAEQLRAAGRGVIRACSDDFQNPPEVRWQLGPRSAEGFFRYQIDFASLRALLLEPLGSAEPRPFHTTCYDVHASRPHRAVARTAERSDLLVFDGLFVHSPALKGCFDLTLFIAADYETCLTRALDRNQERAAHLDDLETIYRERYIPGFTRYCREVRPETRATIVVDAR